MIALAVIGILYGALLALAQTDMKRLVAYSILGNLSFCILGIFCFALTGLNGAVFQTLNEGITGGALLVLVSFLYERYGTTDMALYGGLAGKLPMLATLYVITALALVGLPLLNGFVGEFLVLSGSFPVHPGWVGVATLGVILSATYMLWMVQRIFYGQPSSLVANRASVDLDAREHFTLWPMAVLMLAMGVLSPYWIKAIDGAMSGLANPASVTASHSAPASTPARRGSGDDANGEAMNALRILPEIVLTVAAILVMLVDATMDKDASRKPLGWLAVLGALAASAASSVAIFAAAGHGIFRRRPHRRIQHLLPRADRGHCSGGAADHARLGLRHHGRPGRAVRADAVRRGGHDVHDLRHRAAADFCGARDLLDLHLHHGGLPAQKRKESRIGDQILSAGLIRDGVFSLRHCADLRSHGLHQHRFSCHARGRFANALAAVCGLAMIIVGLGFKVSAAPFHVWTPDVYEGAPSPVVALMSTAPKVAAFAVLLRIVYGALPFLHAHWVPILWWLAVLSMTIGNLGALRQRNVKRMLAYSSIAHAGYLLVAFTAFSADGVAAAIFYAAAYAAMNVGVFAIISHAGGYDDRLTLLDDYRGLAYRSPLLGGAMALFLVSLIGIPFTGGFFGKFYVFAAALHRDWCGWRSSASSTAASRRSTICGWWRRSMRVRRKRLQ